VTHKEKWWQFHKDNPEVWNLFVRFTGHVIEAGYSNYSVNAIFERIRWHTTVETKGSGFKLNNNHRAYYARYFNHMFPQYGEFFRLRETRSEVFDD